MPSTRMFIECALSYSLHHEIAVVSCPGRAAAQSEKAIAATLQDSSATETSSSEGALHAGRTGGLFHNSSHLSWCGLHTSPSLSAGCFKVFCLLHGLFWLSETAAAREGFTGICSAGAGAPFACCHSAAPSCSASTSHRPHAHACAHNIAICSDHVS